MQDVSTFLLSLSHYMYKYEFYLVAVLSWNILILYEALNSQDIVWMDLDSFKTFIAILIQFIFTGKESVFSGDLF